jgi:teichoic acid transport system ATP-binding protein
MSSIVTEDLVKVYKLYDRPLDRLKEFLFHRPLHKEFTALNGISFSIRKGETLGIVGDNGAGKSTLLKILSKTLSPTSGHFAVEGMVSSLLELGAGFHPEFTGIDNIFFYGSLIGIEHTVMKQKIDEIISFSELGDFIHYPIKTYSSGMYVRLAFSVATAVDPDVLIIDEALSVGDQYFQKKCLERMAEFKRKQKTILLCSHDLYQIKTFCEKAIWMKSGKIEMFGESSDIVNAYSGYERIKADRQKEEMQQKQSGSFLFITNMTMHQTQGTDFLLECTVTSSEPFYGHVGWAICRRDMFQITFMSTHMQGRDPILFQGAKKIRIVVENLNLVNDTYLVYIGVFDRQAYKPIAVESTSCTITTGYEILNSLCHFNSTFMIE